METKNLSLSRRNFVKLSGMTGTALALGFYFPAAGKESAVVTKETAENMGIDLTAWISIDTKGNVTILNHRSEMGQGSYQVVPQMIAEELEVNLDRVNILFAAGDQHKYGSQVTGGSSTVRGSYRDLLRTGAVAREMLIEAAMKKWSVTRQDCYAENGQVVHRPSDKKLGYGELVEEASRLQPPKVVVLKERKDYKIIGKSLPRQDTPLKTKGNFDAVYEKAAKKSEAVYETPYQSHSCMEPLNCIAHVHDNKCEIWGPIQGPDWVQKDVAALIGLKPEDLTVNMTFLGGGFGRKAFLDYPHEAAVISKAVGAPVQVVWTREDDMTQGPFRPGMVYQCKAGLGERGNIVAFETKMAGQDMNHQWPGADKSAYNDSVTEGFLEPYLESLPHYSFGDVPLDSPIPVMWWRSVYSSTNGFAFESFMDELALQAGKDPLDFRRQHLDNPRYHELIDKMEEVSGWKSRGKNQGWGVAITECFSSIVGEVVKDSKNSNGQGKLDKGFAVMDCCLYVIT